MGNRRRAARRERDHVANERRESVAGVSILALQHIRDAIGVLERKATPDEVEDYRRFVVALAERVASAHREDGMAVSGPEQAAIEEIKTSLGSPGDVSSAAESGP